MARFLTGKELGDAIYNIIWEAENDLLIVSPYIKLDKYFKKLFDKHLTNPNLKIVIVFGKNEDDLNRSFNKNDLEYFKQFLNVSIIYAPSLHGKYYANEHMGIVTSINLYDYSFINNIEFGVLYQNTLITRLSKTSDDDAYQACMEIADENEVVFIKRPVFQKKLFSKNYMSSKVLIDKTDEFYGGQKSKSFTLKLKDFSDELDFGVEYTAMPTRSEVAKPTKQVQKRFENTTTTSSQHILKEVTPPPGMGYCIRTRVLIPFNPEKPLCYQAYQSWNQFGNENHPEKYCHYSGELSNGETCVKRPVLYKNWKKAQQVYQL